MSTTSHPRPSASTLVAAIALVFALAGTAGAAADLTKRDVKKLVKKQLKKPVAEAVHATNADHATSAANGAVAYGEFKSDGTVRPGASVNMNNLTIGAATNIYCEDQAFKNVSVTGGLGDSTFTAYASAVSKAQLADHGLTPAGFGCPASTEWVYETVSSAGNDPAAFSVLAH